jgi:hypothetical protein
VFLVRGIFSSPAPPVREHPDHRRFLVPVAETLQVVIEGLRCLAAQKGSAIDFAKERQREPLRYITTARRRKFLSRQSMTIYGAKSPPRAGVAQEERPIDVCQAVHGFAFIPSSLPQLPSYPNYKTQMQNYWIPYFDNFGKLKLQMQNCWRCSTCLVHEKIWIWLS